MQFVMSHRSHRQQSRAHDNNRWGPETAEKLNQPVRTLWVWHGSREGAPSQEWCSFPEHLVTKINPIIAASEYPRGVVNNLITAAKSLGFEVKANEPD